MIWDYKLEYFQVSDMQCGRWPKIVDKHALRYQKHVRLEFIRAIHK